MCQLGTHLNTVGDIPPQHPFEAYKVIRVTPMGKWRSSYTRNPHAVTFVTGRAYVSHTAPTNDLHAGFFAFRTFQAAKQSARNQTRWRRGYGWMQHAIIKVSLYGMVAIHTDGYRGQFLKVTSKKVVRRKH